MPSLLRTVVTLAAVSTLALTASSDARSLSKMPRGGFFGGGQTFAMLDAPLGGTKAPAVVDRPTSLSGSTIAALDDGALVIDAESGELVRTDPDGAQTASVVIGRGAAQLVVDGPRKIAYVSDRDGDRIVVVELAAGLAKVGEIKTLAEPFGVALSPDRQTLLVTTVADKALSGYEVGTGRERWTLGVGPEPRGIAISPDGRQALVTFLSTGAVGRVDLLGKGGQPRIRYSSIAPTKTAAVPGGFGRHRGFVQTAALSGPGIAGDAHPDKGRSFARNAFAATFIGHGMAVVPHQVSTPHMANNGAENTGTYGGGGNFQQPIEHRLAFMSLDGRHKSVRTAMATISLHQPRALAYDNDADVLWVAGYGSDEVLAVRKASQAAVHGTIHQIASPAGACGPNGIAVADKGVYVYCSLTRSVVRLEGPTASDHNMKVAMASKPLGKAVLSDRERRGKTLFRRGRNPQLSASGVMACASCHAEGRTDGLSWRIEGHNLQTPLLAGRLLGSHPFKWDGQDKDLKTSLRNTVRRLGGTGISANEAKDLRAYLATLEPPRAPTPADHKAVARGKELFEGDLTGCAGCHDGPLLTDQQRYELAADLPAVDTPSLLGLATSAPYYHDGSARTLRALLMGNGNIHGMGRTSRLSDPQLDDLVAYLETL